MESISVKFLPDKAYYWRIWLLVIVISFGLTLLWRSLTCRTWFWVSLTFEHFLHKVFSCSWRNQLFKPSMMALHEHRFTSVFTEIFFMQQIGKVFVWKFCLKSQIFISVFKNSGWSWLPRNGAVQFEFKYQSTTIFSVILSLKTFFTGRLVS